MKTEQRDGVTFSIKERLDGTQSHCRIRALKHLADHTGVFTKRDENQANALALAFEQIMARGSKAPIRRDTGIEGE